MPLSSALLKRLSRVALRKEWAVPRRADFPMSRLVFAAASAVGPATFITADLPADIPIVPMALPIEVLERLLENCPAKSLASPITVQVRMSTKQTLRKATDHHAMSCSTVCSEASVAPDSNSVSRLP